MNIGTSVGRRAAPARTAAQLGASGAISSIGASASTVLNDGATTVTITITAYDNLANPVVGASVVMAGTGSGNTFSSPAVTNSLGVTSCTFATTGATAHVISAYVGGQLITGTVTVTGVASQTASATNTTIASDASSVQVGSLAHITVQAKTSAPANKTVGGDTVTLSNSGGTTTGTMSAVTDVGDGTYTATFTVTASGTATTITGTINGVTISGGTLPTVTGTAATTYFTPNLVNNASFESTWCSFEAGGGGSTPTGSSMGYDPTADGISAPPLGTKCIKRTWKTTWSDSNDQGGHIAWNFGSGAGTNCVNRLWWRAYIYITDTPDRRMKFWHIYDSYSYTQQWVGLYLYSLNGSTTKGDLCWLFTAEDNASTATKLVSRADLIGGWHSIEVDYWHYGDDSQGGAAGVGYASAAFWWDNVLLDSPYGAGNSSASWHSGRLNIGKRTVTAGTNKIGVCGDFLGVLNNGNTIAGAAYVDNVAISTLGRIGP